MQSAPHLINSSFDMADVGASADDIAALYAFATDDPTEADVLEMCSRVYDHKGARDYVRQRTIKKDKKDR
jgi:membrane-bound lytic murein transglycosylase MltF